MSMQAGKRVTRSLAVLAVGVLLALSSARLASAGGFQVLIDTGKVSLTEHRLEMRASGDASKVTIRVTGESGAVLADDERTLSPPLPAGTPLTLSWVPSSDDPVARIDVRAFSRDGNQNYTVTITPWAVAIPHEEVNFKTDSAQIAESERPKLEASFAKVNEQLDKAKAIAGHPEIRVTLFILGHTDTVGDAAYNLRLSRQRAQAIARWFKQRGLRTGIAFEGFGESLPLVKTADEVDEPRNRRVDYILSVNEPTVSSGVRHSFSRLQ